MFLNSLINVGYLLLMAVPGFITAKTKLFKNESAVSVISVILLYICQPFITFNAFLNTEYNSKIFINAVIAFFLTALLMLLLCLIGWNILRFEPDHDKRGIMAYAGSFGNIGYMCVPFLMILMPNNTEILLYASSAIVAFNITGWSVGNYLLTRDKQFISIKRAILNPATLSLVAALPFFFFNINFIRFPSLSGLQNVIALFSGLVAPLAMTILGIKLSEIKPKELFLDYKVYVATAIRLILSPILAFGLLMLINLFWDISAIRLNIIALAAMPAANNLMMFCSMYQKDTNFSSAIIMLSTLLSIITIPIALTLLV
jgi:predicted permease